MTSLLIFVSDNSGFQGNHYYVSLIDYEFAMGIGSLVPWYKKLSLLYWAGMFYAFGGLPYSAIHKATGSLAISRS